MIRNDESAEILLEETSECRAAEVGVDGFAECLDVGPKACPYALPFGYAFLCSHPRIDEILEQTRLANTVGAGKG